MPYIKNIVLTNKKLLVYMYSNPIEIVAVVKVTATAATNFLNVLNI